MNEVNNILEGHYSNETKVKRPKITTAEPPQVLPKRTLFSEAEANQKLNSINTDIYEGAKKEKSKNEFNKSLYFKIFGGVALATAGIAGICRIKKK